VGADSSYRIPGEPGIPQELSDEFGGDTEATTWLVGRQLPRGDQFVDLGPTDPENLGDLSDAEQIGEIVEAPAAIRTRCPVIKGLGTV
jgi:hypothetical protein